MNSRVVTADVLRDTPEGPRLVGSACAACGAVAFPAQASCPRCTGTDTAERLLAPTGTLWTLTVQRFPPKTPYLAADGPVAPFGVGYVDLGEVIVESRLVASSADELRIGMAVELVVVPFHTRPTARQQLTYAFSGSGGAMTEVAIVGIGIHPFGRTPGMSGRASRVRTPPAPRCATPASAWGDVQFAFGGSSAAGNADALVADLGLTGIEFVNV